MKTILLAAAITFASCGNNTEVQVETIDTAKVDSVIVTPYDSTKVDSIRADSNLNPLNIRK